MMLRTLLFFFALSAKAKGSGKTAAQKRPPRTSDRNAASRKNVELRFERSLIYPLDISAISLKPDRPHLRNEVLAEAARELFDYYESTPQKRLFKTFPAAREEFAQLDAGGRRSEFFGRWQRVQASWVQNVSAEAWDFHGEVLWDRLLDSGTSERCGLERIPLRVTAMGEILDAFGGGGAAGADCQKNMQAARAEDILKVLHDEKLSPADRVSTSSTSFPDLLASVSSLKKRVQQLTTVYFQNKLNIPFEFLEVFLFLEPLIPHGGVRPHVHTGAVLAGMYFPELPQEGSVVLQFYDPRGGVPPFGLTHFRYPQAEELVLFPAWVSHGLAWSLRGGGGSGSGTNTTVVAYHVLVYDRREHLDWEADLSASFIATYATRVALPKLG